MNSLLVGFVSKRVLVSPGILTKATKKHEVVEKDFTCKHCWCAYCLFWMKMFSIRIRKRSCRNQKIQAYLGYLRDMFYTHHSKEKRPERISGFQTILLNVVKGCKGL